MTIDVEDYFQVQAFAECIRREQWDQLPSRVEGNVAEILKQFDHHNVKGTFFTLGWIAERHHSLIREILAGGHELASHGYGHQLVHKLKPSEFRDDVVRAKGILEDIGGVEIKGYRAPTFSIGAQTPWAYQVLMETGHRYSSSVYPVSHDLYGDPAAARFAHRPAGGAFVELPMTTLRAGSRNLPISGGGYFRLLPYAAYRAALRRFGSREGRPGIFYLHPWEVDAHQPRVDGASRKSNFRHYLNIAAVPRRLERLLGDFRWGRMDHVFKSELASSA